MLIRGCHSSILGRIYDSLVVPSPGETVPFGVIFDAVLYVRVRRFDEPAKSGGVYRHSRPELYMAHELAGALQQAGGVRQRRALKETYVYVRREYVDIAEGRISQTGDRTTVMQGFQNFVPACPHHLKPVARDGSQFTGMRVEPRINGGIAFDSTVESQQ